MHKTVVHRNDLPEVLAFLDDQKTITWDFETTGLSSFHDSDGFSVAMATLSGEAFYFNFREYPDLDPGYVLKPEEISRLFLKERDWVAHNAKFDMHFAKKSFGFETRGMVFDTAVLCRILDNRYQYVKGGYSLDACAKRYLSIEKDDRVKEWLEENKAYVMVSNGEGKSFKHYYFQLVPFALISEYAMQDAIVTSQLYEYCHKAMYPNDSLRIEIGLTPVLFRMESRGVVLDQEYCKLAHASELSRVGPALERLQKAFGQDFTDSAKFLGPVLEARGYTLSRTFTGDIQTSDESLTPYKSDPDVEALFEYRDAIKRSQTYFSNYLSLVDRHGRIHPDFKQSGTTTGRMACSNPNLQNIPADDTGEFPVRRAFRAEPDFVFVAIDYKALEFRFMLEYGGERELAQKIVEGLDPHDEVAKGSSITRAQAKVFNYMIPYGAGLQLLANRMGVTKDEAKTLKRKWMDSVPGVRRFLWEAPKRMERNGFVKNCYGRRYFLEDPKFSYKAANLIIQGGTADVVKKAMVACEKFLSGKKSYMSLQIHDEILFSVHESELDLIPQIKRIMEDAYEAKVCPLECSVMIGPNFHDMEEWSEKANTSGEGLSSKGH